MAAEPPVTLAEAATAAQEGRLEPLWLLLSEKLQRYANGPHDLALRDVEHRLMVDELRKMSHEELALYFSQDE
jgi:hypothetical protein